LFLREPRQQSSPSPKAEKHFLLSLAGAEDANDPNCVVTTGDVEFLVSTMLDGPVNLPPSVVVSVTNIADLEGGDVGRLLFCLASWELGKSPQLYHPFKTKIKRSCNFSFGLLQRHSLWYPGIPKG